MDSKRGKIKNLQTLKYEQLPNPQRIRKAVDALRGHGVTVLSLEQKESALAQLQEMIQPGASVMTGASVTLEQIGLIDCLMSGEHPWKYLKSEILKETDPEKRIILRRQATQADYYIGSVQAITEDGEIVIASATGSQIPGYAYTSRNVIWVVGAQKIVRNLEEGIRRVKEYAYSRENLHMKQLYGPQSGSLIGKILIFDQESPLAQRNIYLLLVNEVLGF